MPITRSEHTDCATCGCSMTPGTNHGFVVSTDDVDMAELPIPSVSLPISKRTSLPNVLMPKHHGHDSLQHFESESVSVYDCAHHYEDRDCDCNDDSVYDYDTDTDMSVSDLFDSRSECTDISSCSSESSAGTEADITTASPDRTLFDLHLPGGSHMSAWMLAPPAPAVQARVHHPHPTLVPADADQLVPAAPAPAAPSQLAARGRAGRDAPATEDDETELVRRTRDPRTRNKTLLLRCRWDGCDMLVKRRVRDVCTHLAERHLRTSRSAWDLAPLLCQWAGCDGGSDRGPLRTSRSKVGRHVVLDHLEFGFPCQNRGCLKVLSRADAASRHMRQQCKFSVPSKCDMERVIEE